MTTAGTYHDTLTNAGGCDSIVTLTLTVNNLPTQPTITHTGNTLTTTATGLHYQWQRNNSNLPGDTTSTLTLTQNGSYTLVITDANGCSNTSAALQISNVGINELDGGNARITIHPNPTSGLCQISIEGISPAGSACIIQDMTGRTIRSIVLTGSDTVFHTSDMTAGIYICTIVNDGKVAGIKKLVVD